MKRKKKLLQQIVRFGIVGGSAFLIDACILFSLTELFGVHYLLSGAISFTVSVVYNYILSIIWVFDIKTDRNQIHELIIFIFLSIVGLVLNQIIMWFFVEILHWFYMFSKIVATAIVMVYNFITRKLFIEKR